MKLHRDGNITLYYTQLIMARSEALARLFDQPFCAIHRRFEVCRASFAPVPCLNKQTGPSPLPLKLGVNSACENRRCRDKSPRNLAWSPANREYGPHYFLC
jgi:hypothetical protein